jgi:hypothetical protein
MSKKTKTTKQDGAFLSADELCSITELTDRQHRRLASDGRIPHRTSNGWPMRETLAGMVKYLAQRLTRREGDPLRVEQTALTRAKRLKLEEETGRAGTLVDALKFVGAVLYENKQCEWALRRIHGAMVARFSSLHCDGVMCNDLEKLAEDAWCEFYKEFLALRLPNIAETLGMPAAELQAAVDRQQAPAEPAPTDATPKGKLFPICRPLRHD